MGILSSNLCMVAARRWLVHRYRRAKPHIFPKITGNNRLTPLRSRKNSGKLLIKPPGTVT